MQGYGICIGVRRSVPHASGIMVRLFHVGLGQVLGDLAVMEDVVNRLLSGRLLILRDRFP